MGAVAQWVGAGSGAEEDSSADSSTDSLAAVAEDTLVGSRGQERVLGGSIAAGAVEYFDRALARRH